MKGEKVRHNGRKCHRVEKNCDREEKRTSEMKKVPQEGTTYDLEEKG